MGREDFEAAGQAKHDVGLHTFGKTHETKDLREEISSDTFDSAYVAFGEIDPEISEPESNEDPRFSDFGGLVLRETNSNPYLSSGAGAGVTQAEESLIPGSEEKRDNYEKSKAKESAELLLPSGPQKMEEYDLGEETKEEDFLIPRTVQRQAFGQGVEAMREQAEPLVPLHPQVFTSERNPLLEHSNERVDIPSQMEKL